MLGNGGCDEIHYCAYCRGVSQIAVNHEPDVARERGNIRIDPDEIVVSLAQKAGQASHTHPSPRRNQMFADVVQFAGHRAVAGNTEQPPLLWHFGEAVIKGNKLPPLGHRQVSVGSVPI